MNWFHTLKLKVATGLLSNDPGPQGLSHSQPSEEIMRQQFEAWYEVNKTVPLGAVVRLDWNGSMGTYKHWAAAEAFRVWKAAVASCYPKE